MFIKYIKTNDKKQIKNHCWHKNIKNSWQKKMEIVLNVFIIIIITIKILSLSLFENCKTRETK